MIPPGCSPALRHGETRPKEHWDGRRAARRACSCAVVDGGFTGTAPGAPGTGISGRCAGAVIGSGRGGGGMVDAGADGAGGGAMPLMTACLQ